MSCRRRIAGPALAVALSGMALSAGVGSVAAQVSGKPPPPETSILPDSDQAPGRARQDTLLKRETLPPLALPDIVVFGRATSTMREGSKLFSLDKRTALDREIGAPTGDKGASSTGLGGGRLLAAGERTASTHQARAWLRGGSYGEVVAGGDYWRAWENWRLVADAGAEYSGGHVTDSAFMSGRGGATGVRPLGSNAEIRATVAYSAGTREEWGTAIPTAGIPSVPAGTDRSWFDGQYGLELDATLRRGLTLHASAGGRHAGFDDEDRLPGILVSPRSNGGWAETSLEWLTGRALVRLTGRTEGDRLTGPRPGQTTSLSTATFKTKALFGRSNSVMLGVVWYGLEGGLGQTSRIWPLARFSSQYTDRLTMFAAYQPGIDYLRLGEARNQNPFVANGYQVVAREERFNLTIGLRYTLSRGMTIRFEVARRLYDRLPLWRRAPITESESDGLFVLDGLASVGLSETRLSIEGEPAPGVQLEGALVVRAPTGGGIAELPHLPRFSVRGSLEAQGPWRFGTSIRLVHMGERFGAPDGGSDRRLSTATDLGLRVSHPVGNSVTGWLELRNLLGQDMARWEGYLLPGRTSALGFSVRF